MSHATFDITTTGPDTHRCRCLRRLGRGEVINRAQDWVNRHPTYNQNAHLHDLDDDGHLYRTDCSGFVSMAWHLTDTNGGPNTQGLMNYVTTLASRSYLKPGDALIDPNGAVPADRHVVLFAGWADSDHTRFNLYEMNGTLDMVYRTRYLSDYSSQFAPVRYTRIVDNSSSSYAPPAPVNTCRLGADYAENRLDVILDNYRNVKFTVDTCIRKLRLGS